MLPAAIVPPGSPRPPREAVQESFEERRDALEDQLCPHCGQTVTAGEVAHSFFTQLTEKIHQRQERLAELKEEVAKSKLSCSDCVEVKLRLAEQWNTVLLARLRVKLMQRACDSVKKLARKEVEELQLLEKSNRRRGERLRQVGGKNFSHKEKALRSEIAEEQRRAAEKLNELVEVRRTFLNDLYLKVFPIEVLPLSEEDEGAEDYYDQTSIDCDRVLELEGGWVLGGVHQHPTPHIAIVAPSLPASGDHTPYLSALQDRARGDPDQAAVHPVNDPYLSTPAALVFVAHFVEVIGWVLDQPLPFPLHRHIAISEYGNPVKKRRSFLAAMAKLDDNIMYLCFSQHVPVSALSPGHTLQNLLALVTHSQLGRAGAFECFPEMICYHSSLYGGGDRRRRRSSTRDSPLLLSHDMDDSQPPNVSYASTHSLSSSSSSSSGGNGDQEEAKKEGEEQVGGVYTQDSGSMDTSQVMDWEHLDPSLEELRLFEEEQMRRALNSAKPSTTSTTTSAADREAAACQQAQEVEIYRQRLRRLDYNSTYMDYAALTSTGSSGGGSGGAGSPLASAIAAGGTADNSLTAAAGERTGKWSAVREGSPSSPRPTADEASSGGTVASSIFGTLSSLWTSTFGGSKS